MIRQTLTGSMVAALMLSGATFAAADKGAGSNATPPAPPAMPGNGANAATSKTAPKVLGIRTDIQRPEGAKKSGAKSKYPFDDLEVGGSFGVVGKTASSFSSIIYSAQQRHAVDDIDPATNQVRTRVKKLKGGATEVVDKVKLTRRFSAYDVDPKTDPEGATVRVFRDE